VINKVIYPRQSTFLEVRDLLSSVLVAKEALEEIKKEEEKLYFFQS